MLRVQVCRVKGGVPWPFTDVRGGNTGPRGPEKGVDLRSSVPVLCDYSPSSTGASVKLGGEFTLDCNLRGIIEPIE